MRINVAKICNFKQKDLRIANKVKVKGLLKSRFIIESFGAAS